MAIASATRRAARRPAATVANASATPPNAVGMRSCCMRIKTGLGQVMEKLCKPILASRYFVIFVNITTHAPVSITTALKVASVDAAQSAPEKAGAHGHHMRLSTGQTQTPGAKRDNK